MKTIVLSTLITVAAIGNSFAASATANPVADKNRVSALKAAVAFHEQNMIMLYNQYDLAVERIRNSRGNHAQLEGDRAYFVGVFQQDIANGIRVAESGKAIAELEARYAKLHQEREAYEAKAIANLRNQLAVARKKEDRAFAKAQKELSEVTIAAR